jgi:coenzyme F420 hydrogenase subunit beta
MTDANPNFLTLKRDVIDTGLCTRCGTCVGVCPEGKLEFADPLGNCLPVAAAAPNCADCPGWCLEACPGAGVDYVALNRQVFGKLPDNFLLGQALDWQVAWAADPEIRAAGASGGVLTAMARHLLESNTVQGIVCLIDDPAQPLLPRPVIARDMEALRLAQQSKYSIAPVNTILRELEAFDGEVAFVGLPDQVASLRKLQKLGHPAMKKVKVIFGSYCGAVQHFTAVTAFLRKNGVRDPSLVRRVEYRAGAWPGKLRITLTDGRTFELEKFYANYMTLFYSVERSLLDVDLSNELADLSFGDAWAPRYEERREGFSLIAVRTERGREIFDRCKAAGKIQTQPSSLDDSLSMHSHGLYNKKYAVWSRIDLRRWMGGKVPDYGYVGVRTFKQKCVGLLIALVFAFGRTRLARAIVQIMPMEITGRAFTFVRKHWRNATRPGRSRTVARFRVRLTSPAATPQERARHAEP